MGPAARAWFHREARHDRKLVCRAARYVKKPNKFNSEPSLDRAIFANSRRNPRIFALNQNDPPKDCKSSVDRLFPYAEFQFLTKGRRK